MCLDHNHTDPEAPGYHTHHDGSEINPPTKGGWLGAVGLALLIVWAVTMIFL